VVDLGDVAVGLSRSYLFEGFSAAEIEPLAVVSRKRRLVRGEYVFHAGDPADELWVVVSGEVKDCVSDVDGNEVVHFVHGPGMTFGEHTAFKGRASPVADFASPDVVTAYRSHCAQHSVEAGSRPESRGGSAASSLVSA